MHDDPRTPSSFLDQHEHTGFFRSPQTHLQRLFPESPQVRIIAKLDLLQMTGSTKERTAASLLRGLVERGELGPGGTVVESTSGNLGTALARQCALSGHRFVAVVDETANSAAVRTMRAYGAEVDVVPTPPDGNRLAARVARVRSLLAQIPGSATTDQYGSPDNPAAHESSTMPEIVAALGAPPDRMYVATSTTGTVLGCQQAILRHGWPTELIAVDAEGSVLFGGDAGPRQLPGLGAGFVTDLSRRARPDAVHRIGEREMIIGCRLLARREGILAGASTGAIVAAVGRDIGELPAGTRVAMLVHDSGVPYHPTVYDDAWTAERIGPVRDIEAALSRANPFAR
ncbi:pyridoxal-phosphate dependent enzyme [Brachybacterium hainanense]|uniref:Pyridoxal-phosphate dependent enzyme n=1 Tax=Brachybacterium hainanense TaxID=1541174 RepID=A0ABV6RCA2_9MICO